MTKLLGRTREQIEAALKDKTHDELLDVVYQLATLEPLLTAGDVAARSRMNKREVLRDFKCGKFVDPVFGAGFFFRGSTAIKVGLSAANAWRRSFFVPVTVNGKKEAE